MNLLRLLFVLACMAALPVVPVQAASRKDDGAVLVIDTKDGPRRAFLSLLPRSGPQPTVIVLHGRIAAAHRTMTKYDFDEVANRMGYHAIFPDGLKGRWQDGRVKKGRYARIDDVGYLKSLVARLVDDGIADRHRIFLVGISNGGMMTYRMACEAGDLFVAIGTTLANMPDNLAHCPLKPKPLVAVNASKDAVIPFDGGTVARLPRQGVVIGAPKTIARFVAANGCSEPETVRLPDSRKSDGVSVLRHSWRHCRTGKPVVAFDILGGGHAVSGKDTLPVRVFGKASPDINTAETIFGFFNALK